MYGAPTDVDPVYTGRFGFSSPEFGDFSLEIELSKYLGGVYEISRAKWIKKGTTEASSPLDLNMIQFNGLAPLLGCYLLVAEANLRQRMFLEAASFTRGRSG